MTDFMPAAKNMLMGQVCGIVGGKQITPQPDFALPASMGSFPAVWVHGKIIFPCAEAGGIDLRSICHSSTPNCALVFGEFGNGVLTVASLMTIKDVKAGHLLTINHDTEFDMCGCGMCAKSVCNHCKVHSILMPCPACKRELYCSHLCCEASRASHSVACASCCANMAGNGRLVMSQYI